MTFPIEPFTRDPISVRLDPQARLTISLAIEQHRKHEASSSTRPYIRVRVSNPRGKLTVRDDTPDQLSENERGFLRALYHDERIHQWTKRKKPDAVWSLKREWEDVPLPGQDRYLKLTIFPHTSGHRAVKDGYKRKAKYTENAGYPGAAAPPYEDSAL